MEILESREGCGAQLDNDLIMQSSSVWLSRPPSLPRLIWWDWIGLIRFYKALTFPRRKNKSTFLDVSTKMSRKVWGGVAAGSPLDRRKWNKSLTELNWEIVYKLQRRELFLQWIEHLKRIQTCQLWVTSFQRSRPYDPLVSCLSIRCLRFVS